MKHKYTRHLGSLALAAMMSTASGTILLGPITNPANGHLYYLLDESTWQGGEASAISLGGHLVTINDALENAWVFNTFNSFWGVNYSLWIGFYESGAEGNYVWSSNESVTFTYWEPSEPTNSNGVEAYAHMFSANDGRGSQWNDLGSPNINSPQVNPLASVVEVIPEPSAAILLLSGAALCFRRRSLRTHERSRRVQK